MRRSLGVRVVVPTVVTAVVSSGLAVVINLATEWKTNPWAWVVVAVLTIVSSGVSLWLSRAADTKEPAGEGGLISRSAIGTFSNSTIITGDGNDIQR